MDVMDGQGCGVEVAEGADVVYGAGCGCGDALGQKRIL